MIETLAAIVRLVSSRSYRVSNHAYEEMTKDDILPLSIVKGIETVQLVEDHPDANRGPSVLVLSREPDMRPLHAVWGISK